MSEKRPAYGTQLVFKTTCDYRLAIGGEIEQCTGELTTEAKDALDAASLALEVVRQAAGPHTVSSLVLSVSLDV